MRRIAGLREDDGGRESLTLHTAGLRRKDAEPQRVGNLQENGEGEGFREGGFRCILDMRQ